ncbi:MAG TPA: substrate-binding domain-containing protein, partial [Fibrobacteraceae bacterium]|nr:substrate-binding domain-containing protein [Fibrobacteraceae bacterium]
MQKKPLYGLLINEIGNLFQKQVWRAFVSSCEQKGIQAVGIIGKAWHSPHNDELAHNTLYRLVPYLGLDGSVVAESVLSTHEPFSQVEDVCGLDPTRTVYLGEPPYVERASLNFDASSAILAAITHLVKVHHCHKIACVTGVPTNPDTQARLAAFREALRSLSIPLDKNLEEDGNFTNENGGEAALALLNRDPEIDAIFFMNDTMAIGAQQAFEFAGIPLDRVRMVSMDDIAEARWMRIPLSTIRQPTEAMSRRAVEILAGNEIKAKKCQEMFLGELVIRSSCGCHRDPGQSGRDEFIEEQMRSFFLSRAIRQAAQILFSNLEPASWDNRVARTLLRAQISWAGILEWKSGLLPEDSLAEIAFHRWIEYGNGLVLRDSEQRHPPAEILAERIASRSRPCVIVPLVCQSNFLGVCIMEVNEALENYYEPLMLQLSAALQGTWLMESQQDIQRELISANQQLLNLSNRDELTGVLNRRGF